MSTSERTNCTVCWAVLAMSAVAAIIVWSMVLTRGNGTGSDDGQTAPGPQATVPVGPFTTGEPVPVVEAPIGPAGGTVEVAGSGTSLDGFSIDVPAEAMAGDTTFAVSSAAILSHDYGELVTPLSPLIRVDNGGGYAGDVMEVTIPVDVPDGWFAMAFLRDPATGALEGLPLLRADAGSVTVGTRHFSEFFVSGVLATLLPPTVETGFDPEVDMWQFPNHGSAIAPGGHCAGMSLSAMWFFIEQKPVCGCSLWGRYDNDQAFVVGIDTPDLWEDDARGLRWASTVQKDVPWVGNEAYDQAWHAMYSADQALQLAAFRYAMAITGEPQFVLLSTPTGTPAHAMVAYAVDGDDVLITDPNTPDINPDWISYNPALGRFDPFVTGVVSRGPTFTFSAIGYAAKSALFDWDSIGVRFAEAESGTTGMDRFDSIDLMAVELDADGMEVHEILDGGYVPGRDPLPAYATTFGVSGRVRATFYAGTSVTPGPVAVITSDAASTVPVTGSYASLAVTAPSSWGVLLEQWVDTVGDWRWSDFRRITVGPFAPVTTTATTITPPPPPDAGYDCSQPRPEGIAGLDWDLHCSQIGFAEP